MSRERDQIDRAVTALERGQITRAQFLRRALTAGMSASAAGALLAACGGTSGASSGGTSGGGSPARRAGGSLTIAVTPSSTPITPFKTQDPGGRVSFQPVVNYLTHVTPDLKVVPELATSWSTKDSKTWVVKLREGVKFHSGRPLTADDVVATFDRVVDPKSGSTAVSAFQGVLEKGATTKIDDHTVRFELSRPQGGFPYTLFTYQAAILPANFSGDFGKSPDGTGPFKLTNYTPGQGGEYVRNPHYWETGAPALDRLKVVFFTDTGAQVNAMQSGTADIMVNVPLDAVPSLQSSGQVKLLSASSASYAECAMRVDRHPFDDKRVRQALALCLDREQIVQKLWGGLADIGNDHLIAPVYPLFKQVHVPQRKQDYAKAKSLLADAGYPNGLDIGALRTHNLLGMPQYAQTIQAMAKPAGIRMSLKIEPDDTYYQHWTTAPFSMEAWIHRAWPSQLLNLGYRSKAPWNMSHWSNKEFDSLVDRFDAATNEHDQGPIANDIAALMNDETPAIISFFYKTTKAVSSRVVGQVADPTDFVDLRRTSVQ